jgi:hypothetical protein
METLYVLCVLQDFVVWTVQNIVGEFLFLGLCWTGENEALIVATTSDLGTKFNLNSY